jgi:hypothetical protein
MHVTLQLLLCSEDGREETVTEIVSWHKDSYRIEHLGLTLAEATLRQAATEAASRRSAAIQQGMQRALAEGMHIGRPQGAMEGTERFLATSTSQRVIGNISFNGWLVVAIKRQRPHRVSN